MRGNWIQMNFASSGGIAGKSKRVHFASPGTTVPFVSPRNLKLDMSPGTMPLSVGTAAAYTRAVICVGAERVDSRKHSKYFAPRAASCR